MNPANIVEDKMSFLNTPPGSADLKANLKEDGNKQPSLTEAEASHYIELINLYKRLDAGLKEQRAELAQQREMLKKQTEYIEQLFLLAQSPQNFENVFSESQSFRIKPFLALQAGFSTAKFIIENMPSAPVFPNTQEHLRHALSIANVDGLVLEFGVFQARTINMIAEMYSGPIYGFDSFEGLPENWRTGYAQGAFAMPALPKVKENVTLIKGWFENSLPNFLATHPGNCKLLHVDCDLYSSTCTVLELLEDRIVPGTVIVFDEYFNYPGWEQGEHKAFTEFLKRKQCSFEYISYTVREQMAVKITADK